MSTIRRYRENGKYVDVPEDSPELEAYKKSWPLDSAPKKSPDKGDEGNKSSDKGKKSPDKGDEGNKSSDKGKKSPDKGDNA